MRAAQKRFDQEMDRTIALAWHTAAFNAATKSKKGLPKLDEVLKRRRRRPGERQSYKEMLANMRILAERQNALVKRQQAKG